jgi:hypothetical protein
MKERPILFSAPMVRAILDGRKTQTRRVIKKIEKVPARYLGWKHNGWAFYKDDFPAGGMAACPFMCPYGVPGDRLWVRETWQGYRKTSYEYDEWASMESPKDRHEWPFEPAYKADGKNFPDKWLPAIHMPREFSRITLEIKAVRVERLQDISERDCCAEGVGSPVTRDLKRPKFQALWQSINGHQSWDANPWVWVIKFERVKP